MTDHFRRLLLAVFLFLLLSRQGVYFAFADESQPTTASVQDVVKSWADRMMSAKTFDFRWRSNDGEHPDDLLPSDDTAKPKPVPKVITFVSNVRLAVDAGPRARMEEDSETWSTKQNRQVKAQKLYAFDGTKNTKFFPQGSLGFPYASIGPGEIRRVAGAASTLPLLLAYRMLDPALGVCDAKDLEMTSDKGRYDGVDVLVLKIAAKNSTVWVDPTKDFIPVRYTEMDRRTGTVSSEFDLSYSKDATHGWVPTSWTFTWLSPTGFVNEAKAAKVTEYHINEPLADSTFSIEIPDGTWVHDQLASQQYILRNGGEKRPILPGEYRGDNFEELINSNPKSASKK